MIEVRALIDELDYNSLADFLLPIIAEKLEDALGKADIIAINGGSSKGLHDYTVEVIEQKARILSHMIKSGPGSHTSCAVAKNGKPVVGIAGPAIGAEALTDWFIKPLIDKYFGQPFSPLYLKAEYKGAPLVFNRLPGDGWCLRMRGRLTLNDDGRPTVKPVPFGDSTGVNYSNCFIAVANGSIKEGDVLTVELRYPFSLLNLM